MENIIEDVIFYLEILCIVILLIRIYNMTNEEEDNGVKYEITKLKGDISLD